MVESNAPKVKIEKITLRIDDTVWELTLEEARELKRELDSLMSGPYTYWMTVTGTSSTNP